MMVSCITKLVWRRWSLSPLSDAAGVSFVWAGLNEKSRLLFCGSYFRHGFHEDALWSSLNVVNQIRKREEIRSELMPL